ncbi:MAG: hypothetical protein U0Z53_18035 [Blastocatellia bacterium]
MSQPGQRIWRLCYTSVLLAVPLIILIYYLTANDVANVINLPQVSLLPTCAVIAGVALLTIFRQSVIVRHIEKLRRMFDRLAQRRALSIALVGLTAFAASAGMSLLVKMPRPVITDEFAYLLAADTFAHGRLSNPTHPMWVHFESPGIIHQPTYSSKYPPGQGLLMAAGQALTGQPIVGAWLGLALTCAALGWMLMAWLPPRWAVLGGLLAIAHPVIFQWSQNYWGGTVAMTGGALLIGAFRRLADEPRPREAWLMGLGMAVLANSRPYEGAVLSLLVGGALLVHFGRQSWASISTAIRCIVPPVCVVMLVTLAAMSFYNWRVTGQALRMPYLIHQEAYDVAPSFIWQPPRPEPVYRHARFHEVHVDWELTPHTQQRASVAGLVTGIMDKVMTLARAAFPLWPLLIPLLALPLVFGGDKWMRTAMLICALFFPLILLNTWMWPHYAAPVASVGLLIVLQCARYLKTWRWRNWPVGQAAVCICLLTILVSIPNTCLTLADYYVSDWGRWTFYREQIIDRLNHEPGKHLVIVHYGPKYSVHKEWIFNEADIDGSHIVWAREINQQQNRRLIEYFRDRRIWLLRADSEVPMLLNYPTSDVTD